jgi:hypothetical protein
MKECNIAIMQCQLAFMRVIGLGCDWVCGAPIKPVYEEVRKACIVAALVRVLGICRGQACGGTHPTAACRRYRRRATQAAVVRETGDAHALKVEHGFPTPELKPGGVIVKNQFAGINFIDTYHRSGLYPRELPFVGGQEGGGTVAAVSDEAAAQGIKVGDTGGCLRLLPQRPRRHLRRQRHPPSWTPPDVPGRWRPGARRHEGRGWHRRVPRGLP